MPADSLRRGGGGRARQPEAGKRQRSGPGLYPLGLSTVLAAEAGRGRHFSSAILSRHSLQMGPVHFSVSSPGSVSTLSGATRTSSTGYSSPQTLQRRVRGILPLPPAARSRFEPMLPCEFRRSRGLSEAERTPELLDICALGDTWDRHSTGAAPASPGLGEAGPSAGSRSHSREPCLRSRSPSWPWRDRSRVVRYASTPLPGELPARSRRS